MLSLAWNDDAQNEHSQDGADRAEGHEAEAVVRRVAVGTDGGHADAQRHNEWNGHGAGGHAAGIKSDRQKLFGDERGQTRR